MSRFKFLGWQTRLLVRLFISLAASFLISGGVFYILTQYYLREQVERQLRKLATLALEELSASDSAHAGPAALQSELSVLDHSLRVHVSLLDSSGTLLLDSRLSEPQKRVSAQPGAPWLQRSKANNEWLESYFSPSESQTVFIYFKALPSRPAGASFLRLVAPEDQLMHPLSSLRGLLFLKGLMMIGFTLFLFMLFTAGMDRDLQQLVRELKETVSGKRQTVSLRRSENELGELSRLINTLARRLSHSLQELRQDREQLNAILASISEGILAIDANKRIIFYNQLAMDLLGLSPGEILEESYYQVIRHAELLTYIQTFFEKPYRVQSEMSLESNRILEVTLTPLGQEEASPGCVIVLRDITQYKKLEKIRRDFVANVSHEFKTPLAAIRGYGESLKDWALNDLETSQRYVEKILAQSRQLENLVSDLLELARIERMTSLEMEAFNPIPLLIELVQHYWEIARKKQIQLDFQSPDTPIIIKGQPEMFRTIMANLLDNAIKYTPGGGRVQVHLQTTNEGVVCSVQDTGIGIPEQEQDRIFERFYRVDKARSRQVGGTGLGLSIVKHLAEIQHARISVLSQEGQGSCFSLTFLRG